MSLPVNPPDPFEAVFKLLEEFVAQIVEEDNLFAVFPYHLSQFASVEDLLDTITKFDGIPNDIDEWLKSFLQA